MALRSSIFRNAAQRRLAPTPVKNVYKGATPNAHSGGGPQFGRPATGNNYRGGSPPAVNGANRPSRGDINIGNLQDYLSNNRPPTSSGGGWQAGNQSDEIANARADAKYAMQNAQAQPQRAGLMQQFGGGSSIRAGAPRPPGPFPNLSTGPSKRGGASSGGGQNYRGGSVQSLRGGGGSAGVGSGAWGGAKPKPPEPPPSAPPPPPNPYTGQPGGTISHPNYNPDGSPSVESPVVSGAVGAIGPSPTAPPAMPEYNPMFDAQYDTVRRRIEGMLSGLESEEERQRRGMEQQLLRGREQLGQQGEQAMQGKDAAMATQGIFRSGINVDETGRINRQLLDLRDQMEQRHAGGIEDLARQMLGRRQEYMNAMEDAEFQRAAQQAAWQQQASFQNAQNMAGYEAQQAAWQAALNAILNPPTAPPAAPAAPSISPAGTEPIPAFRPYNPTPTVTPTGSGIASGSIMTSPGSGRPTARIGIR